MQHYGKEGKETAIVKMDRIEVKKLPPKPEGEQWRVNQAQPIVDVMDQVEDSMDQAEHGTSPMVYIAIGLVGAPSLSCWRSL